MKLDTIEAGPLWKRLGWFVAIWAGGVATLGVLSFVIRAIAKP